jgi:hypothetical protein
MYHCTSVPQISGLRLEDGSFWQILNDALIYVRMPLFAFLAGYIYGRRPLAGDGKHFLLRKMRRLLLPMCVAYPLYFTIRLFFFGIEDNGVFALYNSPYWFVEALFIIFVATVVLERTALLANGVRFSIVLAAAVAIQRWAHLPPIFNLNGSLYLFPYFLCGLACFRFRIEGNYIFVLVLIVFVSAMLFAMAGLLGYVHVPKRISTIALLIGISGPFLMLRSKWHDDLLVFISKSSYAIFLYHMFFTAAAWPNWTW